jgi:hypothetical protein
MFIPHACIGTVYQASRKNGKHQNQSGKLSHNKTL